MALGWRDGLERCATDPGFAGVSLHRVRVRIGPNSEGRRTNGEQEAAVPSEPIRIRWSHQQQSPEGHYQPRPRAHELRADGVVFEQDREVAPAAGTPEADTTDVGGEQSCRRGALG